jgi:hypothetical protein
MMTLQKKFILALVSMVIFMAIISGSISLLSVNQLLDRSVNYLQQGFKEQWNGFLVSHYEEKGNWEGLQLEVLRVTGDPRQREGGLSREGIRILVFDKEYNVVRV